jgi:hypothetical protein
LADEVCRLRDFSFAASVIVPASAAVDFAATAVPRSGLAGSGAAAAGLMIASAPATANNRNRQAFVPGANWGSLRALRIMSVGR